MIEICNSSEIPEGYSKGFPAHKIFVIRKHDKLFAYRNNCPHLGIPLEWQQDRFLDEEGELIQCATHGALFTIDDGRCVAGPCLHHYLHALKVQERDGKVCVDL